MENLKKLLTVRSGVTISRASDFLTFATAHFFNAKSRENYVLLLKLDLDINKRFIFGNCRLLSTMTTVECARCQYLNQNALNNRCTQKTGLLGMHRKKMETMLCVKTKS